MRHLWTRGLQATAPRQQQLLHVEQAYFHPFGPGTQRLYDSPLSWSIELDPSQVWAVTGPGASSFLTAVLLGRSRTEPLLSRSWPLLLNSNATVQDVVSKVAFKTRLKGFGAMSQIGEFADYTARFGALLEEDKVTLLQHFEDFLTENNLPVDHEHIQDVSGRLNLTNLLQRPLIGLSNGQTRRARIARALLKKPRVLVLEEPFSGLDPPNRQLIGDKLWELHQQSSPHLIFTLRLQDGLPEFVTHLVELRELPGGRQTIQYVGRKEQWQGPALPSSSPKVVPKRERIQDPKTLVSMKDVNVSIRGISILTSVNWTIKEGERWLLKGPNGSGKSTVLSLLVGDHPQSYVQPVELFGRQRVDIATSTLQSNLGQISPEIFNAFPRKMTPGAMNGLDAVVTGFHDIFIYRKATSEQTARVHQLAQYFQVPDAVMQGLFAEASPAYQALLLFMRAIVKQPSLLVLDEPFSGMTERMVSACKQYIDEELRPDQALVLVTHYPEDERPASVDSLIEIQDGSIVNEEQM